MPRTPETPVCMFRDAMCAEDIFKEIPFGDELEDFNDIPCNCLKSCNIIKYSFTNERLSSCKDEDFSLDIK
jgi:hypothetical protein